MCQDVKSIWIYLNIRIDYQDKGRSINNVWIVRTVWEEKVITLSKSSAYVLIVWAKCNVDAFDDGD